MGQALSNGTTFTATLENMETTTEKYTIDQKSFTFETEPSYYNPSFWAYGNPDSAEPFSNRYIIGMMEASIPAL